MDDKRGLKGTFQKSLKNISFELLTFSRFTCCFVGDGKDTYFWEDQWVGENCLCSLFLHLYYLSSSKNCTISDLLVCYENPVSFSFRLCRNLTTRETTEVASLSSLLEECFFRKGRRDVSVWNPNPSRGYTCKSLFHLLLDPAPQGVSF